MELQLEDFALAPLIDNVVKTVEPLAAKNNNQLVVRSPRSAPLLPVLPGLEEEEEPSDGGGGERRSSDHQRRS
jgi:hypothetical protein